MAIGDDIRTIFREFNTDGDPTSGPWNPQKKDLRDSLGGAGDDIEASVTAAGASAAAAALVVDAIDEVYLNTVAVKNLAEDYASAAGAASGILVRATIASFLADTTLTYTTEQPGTVSAGVSVGLQTGGSLTILASGTSPFGVATADDVRAMPNPVGGEYLSSMFGTAADGSTDDAAAFGRMAATIPAGSVLRIQSGTHILGSKITFAQDDLFVFFEPGAVLKQADSTLTIDQLVEFSGDRVLLDGISVDGNLAGNATASYTGRAELVRCSGDDVIVRNMYATGVHDKDFACALFLFGDRATVTDYLSEVTGRSSIRIGCFYANLENIKILEAFDTNGVVGCKGIIHDIVPGNVGTPCKKITIRNYLFQSDDTGWLQSFVFDHEGVFGGHVVIDGLDVNCPNTDAVDLGKPVFLETFEMRNAEYNHPAKATYNCTLRIQQGSETVILDNVKLPGNINFDRIEDAWVATTAYTLYEVVRNDGRAYVCTTAGTSGSTGPTGFGSGITDGTAEWRYMNYQLIVKGGSKICTDYAPPAAAIEQFSGNLIVEDGCSFGNLTTAMITTDANFRPITARIGSIHLNGSSGTPYILQDAALGLSTSLYRSKAGGVVVSAPASVSGTFRLPSANSAWVYSSDQLDAAAGRFGERRFMVGGGDFPPRENEGWFRGDQIFKRGPNPSDTPAMYICTLGGASCQTAHADATAVTVGNWRSTGGNVYVCVTAGTTGTGTPPTGTTNGQTDGTAVWNYVDILATFKSFGGAISS